MKKLAVLLVLLLSATMVFAGGQKDTPASTTTSAASSYNEKEAPMLHELVEAGKLPPLQERLPDNPMVVVPYEKVGSWGDYFSISLGGYSDHENLELFAGNMGLVMLDYDSGYSEIVPLVAETATANDDYTVFTFTLRKGLKWSDGKPFTIEDIEFAICDLMLNPEWGAVPSVWTAGGEPVKYERIDEYTFTLSFVVPYFDFLYQIADRKQTMPCYYQKEYCSQAHPKYNPNLEADLKARNLTDWRDYMDQLVGDPCTTPRRWANPDRPSLEAWVIKSPYTGGATQVVLERNPYFWMVDTEGNQLPYVDRLIATVYADPDAVLMGAVGGAVDFGWRKIATLLNQPVLAEACPRIGAELYEVTSIGGTSLMLQLNLNSKNPQLRDLFNKKDFRVALSIGFDRQEVIDTALSGVGYPWQPAPFANSPMYYEPYATQYLQFDPDEANRLLDGIGLDKRNSDGIRLFPDGKPVSFSITIEDGKPEARDQLEVMTLMWKRNLGLDIGVDIKEKSLSVATTANGDHDAYAGLENCSWMPGRLPTAQVPLSRDCRWAPAWVDWYMSGGKSGEQPPESIVKRMDLYEESMSVNSFEARRDKYFEIAQIAADEFEVFGVANLSSTYGIKKTAIANARPSNPETGQYPLGFQFPWSFFWDTADNNRPK